MAIKKSSKSPGKGGKPKRKDIFEDPPVVVGGGNSVDITFLDTATQPGNPHGKKKFRLPNAVTAVVVDDGAGNTQLVRVVPALFKVSFFG